MDRNFLWSEYFDSEVRSRYYSKLSDRYKKKIRILSCAIAILSCGPLANAMWSVGVGDIFASISGVAAGVLGIYVATSSLMRSISAAETAAKHWNEYNNFLKLLWSEFETGKDVSKKFNQFQEEALRTDNYVLSDLIENSRLLSIANDEAERALC